MTLRIGDSRKDRPSIKREQAEERKAAWDTLSAKEKIELLDRRLGKDIGAKRQRTILTDQFEKDKFVIKTDPKPTIDPIPITQKSIVAPSDPTPTTNIGAQETEFTITIFKSSEDDGFVAKIKGIKETAHGATKAEARANAKRMINSLKEEST